ncbi:MAG: DUF3179 domain-containing (seleno)protein, partial [Acidimicrobiia bacterium]
MLLALGVACSVGSVPPTTFPSAYPPAPAAPSGPLDSPLQQAVDDLVGSLGAQPQLDAIEALGEAEDPRVAWVLADVLRFALPASPFYETLVSSLEQVMGISLVEEVPWVEASNHLIAWDLPAPPGYLGWKRAVYLLVEPRWEPFFDPGADIDWRLVSWGGVLIDDRPLGDPDPCPRGCIPALDDPGVTPAEEGGWYPDHEIVFGLVMNGEARAYPRNIMEVHEMVNDTVGGRRLGIPYCTLCGSAQAYLTDAVSAAGLEPLVLRTSGLLHRSNKVMYDLRTTSILDTFTGEAVSGPLAEREVTLPQVTLLTSTWGEWKEEHPETTIVAEDGGIGRSYPADPLGGRDDAGPIFPIGDVDPRLPVQEQVVGVI